MKTLNKVDLDFQCSLAQELPIGSTTPLSMVIHPVKALESFSLQLKLHSIKWGGNIMQAKAIRMPMILPSITSVPLMVRRMNQLFIQSRTMERFVIISSKTQTAPPDFIV